MRNINHLVFLILAGLFIGCGGHSSSPASTGLTDPVPSADDVFLVVLENHSFSTDIGSPSMPFFTNGSLALISGNQSNQRHQR